MARLQRKKSSAKIKKKKAGDEPLNPGENEKTVKQLSVDDRNGKKVRTPSPKPGSKSAQAKPKKKGFVENSLQFLREVKIELKKVTWPTRKQTMGSTAIVIFFVILISVFLGLVDVSLSNLIRVVLR